MKVLLDTDIGFDIDDELAVLLLLHLREVELLGITTVYGNVALRAKIASEILRATNKSSATTVGPPLELANSKTLT